MIHAVNTGLLPIVSGLSHSGSLLNAEKLQYVRAMRGKITQRKLGAMLGVSHVCIGQAQRGERYSND